MSAAKLSEFDVARLQECVSKGGVAVFPTDTVYGVCCDPDDMAAAMRLYELKGYAPVRSPERPAAVMFFALDAALAALGDLHADERRALETLLPGPVTLLLPNGARRFAPACGPDPATVGVRVPRLPDALASLRSVDVPVMQSSANLSGGRDAWTLAEVPHALRDGADIVLDGGDLPGTPSTVIDLREYADSRRWQVLREGALSSGDIARMLDPVK